VIDGLGIVLEETDVVCRKRGEGAYIQSDALGEPYTSGGTVIFRCMYIKKL